MHSFLSGVMYFRARPSCLRIIGISCREAQVKQRQRRSECIFLVIEMRSTDASSGHPYSDGPHPFILQVLIRQSPVGSPSEVTAP